MGLGEPGTEPIRNTRSVVPNVFMFPGAFGDERVLREFRDRLADRASFELIDHPSLEFSSKLLSDMQALGRRAADIIEAKQPKGPLHITGLSFGGMVAATTATLLAVSGREIAFLGVLDPPLDVKTVKESDEGDMYRSRTAKVGRSAVKWAGANGGTRQLTAMIGKMTYRNSKRADSLKRYLVFHCFGVAMERWYPGTLPFRGILVTSRGLGDRNRDRWLAIAPGLTHFPADCRHQEILEPPFVDTLVAAFGERLGAFAGEALQEVDHAGVESRKALAKSS